MALAGRLPAVLVLVATASCSIVSGWSDLQGGPTPDAGTANAPPDGADPGADGGADAGSGAADAAVDVGAALPDGAFVPIDAASVIMTIACGASRCAVGEGCCFGLLGGDTCEASGSCGPASTFATCSDSLQCEALLEHPAQCCQSGAAEGSIACRTSCDGSPIVCDPTFATPGCPSGTTCRSVAGFGYSTCQ